ncbi:MAG: carboxypeptidase regulatory-like domain-containing protein [Verrucomicrobiales bacterium]|nr:carboxypeptidase regulatory-like domain-containing protein [Verrucomicrobiales bacterium]
MRKKHLLIFGAIVLAGSLAAMLYEMVVSGGTGGPQPEKSSSPTTTALPDPPVTSKKVGMSPPQKAFVVTEEMREQRRRQNEEEARLIQEYYDKMSEEDKAARPANVSTESWAIYAAELEESAKENGDVVFFGKVVDESGNPLPKVTVTWQLLGKRSSLAEVMEKGSKKKTFFENWSISERGEAVTDADGRFGITDRRGTALSVGDFKFEGYQWDKRQISYFEFGSDAYLARSRSPRHLADPEKPVVYVMRKK